MAEVPDTGVRPADNAPPTTPSRTQAPAEVGLARLTGLLGVAFAVLLVVGMVLVHRSPSLTASDTDYPVALLSYVMAAVMLVSATLHPALLLVFPGWVALAGLIVLARTRRSGVLTFPRSRS